MTPALILALAMTGQQQFCNPFTGRCYTVPVAPPTYYYPPLVQPAPVYLRPVAPAVVVPSPQAPALPPPPPLSEREKLPVPGVGLGKAIRPAAPENPVGGLPPGNALSNVVASNGQRLPSYAVTGMVWTPGNRPGYATNHDTGHAFVQSLAHGAKLPQLVDDSKKLRVLLVGDDSERRKRAVEDFKKGSLIDFKDDVLVRSCSNAGWEAKDVGLTSKGGLDMYVQAPSGKVMYHLVNYTPEKAANALRQVNRDYDPDKVPGVGGGCPLGFTEDHWPLIVGLFAIGVLCYFLVPPTRPE